MHPMPKGGVIVPPRPSVPCPFAAGTLEIPPGQPVGLLELIHQQINRDVPGTSTQFTIFSSPTNQAPVWLGAFMGKPLQINKDAPANEARPGKLSVKNFGRMLTPSGNPIEFHSSYPGTQTPIGNLQVFSEAPAKIHVIIVE